MIGDKLEAYTFDNLLNAALSEVPNNLDKRQGSIIYDALAPACARLAELFMEMRNVYRDTYVPTATGEALDSRAKEQGLTRYEATFALKRADFVNTDGNPMVITLGTRFSTISDANSVTYYAESQYLANGVAVPGAYNLRCEVSGTIGNEYSGELRTITHIKGLAVATMSSIVTSARNEETDEELRERYFDAVNNKAYGGNVSQYNQVVRALPGVGEVQIYPVWNGGGTVKISVVDADYNPCSAEFISSLKSQIDPEEYTGQGLGIAPIGHEVTVVTPSEVEISVSINIDIESAYTLSQLTPLIQSAISDYFVSVKKGWGVETAMGNYSAAIYVSRVMMAALQVKGVSNVTNVSLNGNSQDFILTQSSTIQQIPKLKGVTVNA